MASSLKFTIFSPWNDKYDDYEIIASLSLFQISMHWFFQNMIAFPTATLIFFFQLYYWHIGSRYCFWFMNCHQVLEYFELSEWNSGKWLLSYSLMVSPFAVFLHLLCTWPTIGCRFTRWDPKNTYNYVRIEIHQASQKGPSFFLFLL